MDALVEFSKTWKGILSLLVVLAFLLYAMFYVINSKIGESENELTPLENSKIPGPTEFDRLCAVSNEGKSCPKLGEPEVR